MINVLQENGEEKKVKEDYTSHTVVIIKFLKVQMSCSLPIFYCEEGHQYKEK